MKNYTMTDLVRNERLARFTFYRDENLFYQVDETNVEYPIPVEDTKGGTFLAEQKALTHMRWIKPHLARLDEAEQARKDNE